MLMLMDLRQQCSISASLSALARSLVEAGGEEPQAQSKVCGVGRILCRFCGCAEREGKANVPVMCWCTTLDLLLFLLSPAASEPIFDCFLCSYDTDDRRSGAPALLARPKFRSSAVII